MSNLYDPQTIKRLFDEMSKTYGVVNLLSSFGFCRRWRKQCLNAIQVSPDGIGIDLMAGMAELCPDLSRKLGPGGHINALDISPAMCQRASQTKCHCPLHVILTDVLTYDFELAAADVVVSSFGLKTFSIEQTRCLAGVVFSALKPGGVFSFVEISVPKLRWLMWPYMFYVNHIIPGIGSLFLGNPDNYRQLGVYTTAFQNCSRAAGLFRDAGLEVQYHSYFFGCATGISGSRPIS